MYPQLPLFENQGLGLAVMSYAGRVDWGLIGDLDLVPDLALLAEGLGDAFEELQGAASLA
jgi:hypothetical protein